ncbi:MAG: helix-turn-helix domain-containing protein [Phreatobacter sp.]|nr:helix-turn-helix domain-containing protein [Phreatobacter sp.]
MEMPPLLTVAAACKALGIGRTTVYGLIANGALVARKIGNKTVLTGASVTAFINGLPPAPIGRGAREGG